MESLLRVWYKSSFVHSPSIYHLIIYYLVIYLTILPFIQLLAIVCRDIRHILRIFESSFNLKGRHTSLYQFRQISTSVQVLQ